MRPRRRRLPRLLLNTATVVSLALCMAILIRDPCFRPTLHWTICLVEGDLHVAHNSPLPLKPNTYPAGGPLPP